MSSGSLLVEPLWLFYRADSALKATTSGLLDSLRRLRALRVHVGSEGSGVPTLMDRLLEADRVEHGPVIRSQLEQTPATMAFLAGTLDAPVFASAPESLRVQMLLRPPGVRLMD